MILLLWRQILLVIIKLPMKFYLQEKDVKNCDIIFDTWYHLLWNKSSNVKMQGNWKNEKRQV